MQFSPSSCYVLFHKLKYSPQLLILCSFLRVRDQVSCTYKMRDKVIVLHILIFMSLGRILEAFQRIFHSFIHVFVLSFGDTTYADYFLY